ncbi:MAG: DinB family protein [Filimonas sp.]|nr:DinB family protein [Filimonas sp.]
MEQAIIRADLATRFEKHYGAFSGLLWAIHEDEMNRVPSYGGWTPGQVADHVIKATGGIPDDNTQAADRAFDEKVDGLAKVFLDVEIKMQSPGFILPGDGPFTKNALLEQLAHIKQGHLENIAAKDPFALCMDMEMPGEGLMTRYEWWNFLLFHLERHTHQLRKMYESFHSA